MPKKAWSGILDATQDGPMCVQNAFDLSDISEDCLLLNVYTSNLSPEKPKAVIVFIHPGGFYELSAQSKSTAGPQYFMDRDIVLVTIQYRLGILGFLSTGTKEAPGNNGFNFNLIYFII